MVVDVLVALDADAGAELVVIEALLVLLGVDAEYVTDRVDDWGSRCINARSRPRAWGAAATPRRPPNSPSEIPRILLFVLKEREYHWVGE